MKLTRILIAWGFFVLASTLPPKWWEVGPFETKEYCETIRDGMAWAGRLYLIIDPCTEWK